MKRFILINSRTGEDKETKDELLFLTIARLPSKMNNGNLFYPKSSDISVSTCAGAIKAPDKFAKYQGFELGDIVDI